MHARPAPAASPESAGALREALARAGFTEQAVVARLKSERLLPTSDVEHELAMHRTRAVAPIDVATRLFLLGVPVEEEAARRALEPAPLDAWVGAGLLAVANGRAAANCTLRPF